MLNLMLDTNVFCRPLDNLTDKNVELEAKSAKELFDLDVIDPIESVRKVTESHGK